MTVKEFKKFVAEIPEEYDHCMAVCPVATAHPNVFAFDGVCPGVSGIVELGPMPDEIKRMLKCDNQPEGLKVLLIAPHMYHEGMQTDVLPEEHVCKN